jgi:hypothetical protein
MSSIANIVAYDGAGTPVIHTFTPISVTRETAAKIVAEWRETSLAVPMMAQPRIAVSLEKLRSGNFKAVQRTTVPVMEAVGSQNAAGYTAAPRVAYEDTIEVTGFFSPRSTSTGKRLVRQLACNIFGGIATSVAPVTTGPIAELFDLLAMPV